eukprot:TRINITY_DN24526_c1_g1_i1.p1 TRINITY_DN24526_c1_g1~~TRINITY_DN24526_c1_g1_i1.p1  ORF type:complete len:265 (+),score=29.73 TRINITY_DN24526_c1_g1_i1:62-856(+)
MGFFSTLIEARTVRMILIPLTVIVTTWAMDSLNDNDPVMQEVLKKMSIQEDHQSFDFQKSGGRQMRAISQLLNYRDKEPWAQWVARWSLWHICFFSVTSFKLSVVPAGFHRWLAILYGICMHCTMYSAYRQWSSREVYLLYQHMQDEILHPLFAFVIFFINILETTFYWASGARMKVLVSFGVYFSVFAFIYVLVDSPSMQHFFRRVCGFPLEGVRMEGMWLVNLNVGLQVFEFANFITHFVVVWQRAPAIEAQTKDMRKKKTK